MNETLTENTKIFIKKIAQNHIKNNYSNYISNDEDINDLIYPKINLESFVDFFVKVFYKNISNKEDCNTDYNESCIKKFIDDYFQNK